MHAFDIPACTMHLVPDCFPHCTCLVYTTAVHMDCGACTMCDSLINCNSQCKVHPSAVILLIAYVEHDDSVVSSAHF